MRKYVVVITSFVVGGVPQKRNLLRSLPWFSFFGYHWIHGSWI